MTSDTRSMYTGMRLFCLIICLIIAGQPAIVTATDTDREKIQRTLQDSLEAMWTGQEFSPELKQRQQAIKAILASGKINKAELASMIELDISSIMGRQRTSRYILKKMPERVDNLFSPQMNWETLRELVWRALSSAIKEDNPILMKVGTLAPPGTPWLTVPETMGLPEIDRLSDGKVLTKIYGGGVMGQDTDVLKKMDSGALDTCGCTALGVLAACPEAAVLLLPGLFDNYAEVDYICEKFRKRLDDSFEKHGYTLLALIDTGYFYLFSSNKITGLADLRRQKVITWFGTIEQALYQELGINPIPIAVPDTVSALSTGRADTNMAPAAWMLGMQAYQYSNYYIKPPLLYSPAAVIVSGHMRDKIQKQTGGSATFAYNVMEVLAAEWNTFEPEWEKQIRDYEGKSLKAFETKCGIKAIVFSPEDQETIQKAEKAVWQKLAGKLFPKDLFDDIKTALENYRSTH